MQLAGVLLSETDTLDGVAAFTVLKLRGMAGTTYNITYSATSAYRGLTVVKDVSEACME